MIEILKRYWSDEDVAKVCAECEKVTPFNGTSRQFLAHCIACGGDWGQMILSGIRELFPNVYEAIPENMGLNPFACLCIVIGLCGVDTSK